MFWSILMLLLLVPSLPLLYFCSLRTYQWTWPQLHGKSFLSCCCCYSFYSCYCCCCHCYCYTVAVVVVVKSTHAYFYVNLPDCNEVISTLPYTDIAASSHKMMKKKKSCTPEMGDIESAKGWCPRRQSSKFLGVIVVVFVTKGNAGNWRHWVHKRLVSKKT